MIQIDAFSLWQQGTEVLHDKRKSDDPTTT